MIKKIISGGQTGVDRAGLDAAMLLKISTGGYCPKGYMTENGEDRKLKKYGLKELSACRYEDRTIKNVLTSDGTVIFCRTDENKNIIGEGTQLTFSVAMDNDKPVIINPTKIKFVKWVMKYNIKILNVAGNRESQYPGIYKKTKTFLIKTLKGI